MRTSIRPGRVLALIAVAYMILLAPAPAHAQTAPPPLVADSASNADGKFLRVYLATFEAGDPIYEKFGHDALWIVDTRARQDASYNWGVFNDKAPHFLANFLRGKMKYSMNPDGPYPVSWDTGRYRRENRTVWVQELNLTPTQKIQLRDFVNWNNRSDNMYYMYDYFRDNCTTRIRDALDRVLRGQVRAALDPVASGVTYRWQARRLLSVSQPAYVGIELAMGHQVDKPLSQWENSFLPMELMNHLRSVNVRDDSGHVAPLIAATNMEFQSTRAPMPATPPDYRWIYAAIGVALGLLFAGLARTAVVRNSVGAFRAFLTTGALWSLVVGFFGLVSNLLWFATDHTVTRANENIMQANILSLILAVVLIGMFFGRGRRIAFRLSVVTAALSVLGFVLQLVPGMDQFNGEIIALLMPAHIGMAVALYTLRDGLLSVPRNETPRSPGVSEALAA